MPSKQQLLNFVSFTASAITNIITQAATRRAIWLRSPHNFQTHVQLLGTSFKNFALVKSVQQQIAIICPSKISAGCAPVNTPSFVAFVLIVKRGKPDNIITMYFCSQTRSPQYKHTFSAQRSLIKTDKTKRFTTALEAESQGYRHLLYRTFRNSDGEYDIFSLHNKRNDNIKQHLREAIGAKSS